jgi:opacity protein-like surface antigen
MRSVAVGVSVLLMSSSVMADDSTAGPVAIASTVAIGAAAGIACWAIEEMTQGPPTDADDPAEGASSGGHAADPIAFGRTGFFAGLQGIFAIGDYADAEQKSLQQALLPFPIRVEPGDHGWGVGGFVGARCHSRFATEAEVQWMTGFTGDLYSTGQGRVARFLLEPIIGTVNFKGYLLTGRFQPYGLVGFGTMTISSSIEDELGDGQTRTTSNTMFAGRFGGGIDVYVTRHIVAKAGVDYVLPLSGIRNFDAIIIDGGLEYRF